MIVKKMKELKKILAAALVLTLLGAVPGTGALTAMTKAHAAAGIATPGNISREESGRSRKSRVREEDPEETGLKSATPGNAERDEDLSYEEPASWGNYISEDGYVVSPAEDLVVSLAEEELVVSPAEGEYPAFNMSETIDGIRITVTAEEGAFPADAVLVVERVPVARAAQAEEAVAEQRPEGQNVAVSYTFDIRVEDQEGTELQPADGSRVNVAFAAALVADSNLETNVYHITEEGSGEKAAEGLPESEAGPSEGTGSSFGEGMETAPDVSSDAYGQSGPEGSLTAEKLEVELDEAGETAVVETDGFSLYTVEFTYNSLQYVMPGGTYVPLADVLDTVGLTGTASAVEVSDSTLFSASDEGGEWVITSHQPFGSTEWMKVTIGGIVYEITVTDATSVTTWAELKSALETSGEITLGNNITISDADITNLNYLFVTDGVTATLNLNGKTLTGGGNNAVITVNSGGKLTIKDSIGGGVITGGNRSGNGGALEVKGTLILQSGTLSGNKAGYGGAVYVNGSNAKFTMTGGTISNNRGSSGGGGVSLYDNATFTMSGGTISENVTSYRGGGVRITKGCVFTMSNGTITNNPPSGTVNVGGGVCVEAGGTFNMTGGKITNNSVNASGGGVYVQGDDEGDVGVAGEDGIFNMSGGEISGNNADSGGGIYEWDGGAVNISGSAKILNNNAVTGHGGGIESNSGILNISGGTISGNTADYAGGGIGFNGTLYLSGGTITNNKCGTVGGGINAVGKFYLQGAPNISGNKRGERDDNLYTTTITITGPLTNSTAIGVETRTPPTFDNGGILVTRGLGTTGSALYTKFKSDNDRYYLGEEVVDGVKEAVLYPKYIIEISCTSSYPNFTPTGTQTLYVKPGSAMTSAVFTANTGYGFSESYSVDTVGGIKTTRTSQSKVTVSGTPTGDTQLIQIRLTPAKILRTATVTPGSYMTRNSSSGQESQTVVSGDAIKSIIYKANSGYYFPEGYTAYSRGITATRDSESQITVSGTPSNTVTLTLTDASLIPATAPTISTQPSNVSMTYGDTGKTVKVTATAPTGHTLSYQWYKSTSSGGTGTAVDGATLNTYTIPSTTTYGPNPYYYCVVTATRNDNNQTATTRSNAARVIVSKAELTVKANARSKTYGGTDPSLTYSVTGLKNSDTMSGSLTRAAGEDAGTYSIRQGTLTVTNSGSYNISYTGALFTINPATLTVTAVAGSKTYGDTDPALTYTATGFKRSDTKESVMNGSLERATGEDVGEYAIGQGDVTAGDNYTISFTGATFTIGKATLTVKANAGSKTYGDTDPELTYLAAGFKNGDDESIMSGSLERATGEIFGEYAISKGSLSAGINYNISFTGATFKINKAPLTVTADAGSKTYGDGDPVLTYTATGFKRSDTKESVMNGSLERATGEDVGEYAIGQGDVTAGDNYTISFTGATFTINKAPLTVKAVVKSKTYGDTDPALNYTATGFKNGDNLLIMSGALERAAGENAGNYAIRQGTLSAGNNYTISYTGANLTIDPAPLTVTAEAKSKTYGDADPELTYTADGFKRSDTKDTVMSGDLARAAGEDVGDYAISQGTVTAGNNYTISYTGADLKIDPAPLTVTAEAKSKTYGDADPELTYTADGFKRSDTKGSVMSGSLERAAGEDVGDYAISQGTVTAGNNYTISYTGADLTINRKEIGLSWGETAFTYNGLAHVPEATATGLVDGDSCDVTVTGAGTDAGSYTATASALSNSNYKLPAEGTKDYTIGRAALSVTTPDAEKVYDGTPLSAAGSITGLVNSETATLAAAGTQTKAGSSTNAYSISWDGTAAEANYEIASETLGTLTVTPKEVTVSGITAASKRYDRSAAAVLNYDSVVISGMIAGDDLSVRATGTFEDEKAGRDKNVNITGITLTGKDAANYKLAASGNQSSTTADITRISSGGSSGTTTVKGYVGSVGGTWNQDGSNWSYTYLDGHRAEGWNYLYYNGRSDWYYFDGAGLMQTGWIDWEENRYYLNPVSDGRKGALLTGWQLIDGNWYYFEPVRGRNQGRMYRNESTPDGYTLGPDGAWTGSSGARE